MQKKISVLLLTSFLLMVGAPDIYAQWAIGPTTAIDLETDVTSIYGFGVYQNVFVDNHLAVNTNMSSTTTCPMCPTCTATVDYPFVVSVLPPGPNAGDAIVLNDPADHMRRIIGLSQAGAVGLFSGSNDLDGASLRLFAPGVPVGPLITPGQVQTVSQGATGAGARAFEHLNNWGIGTGLKSMFSVDQNGDTRITGKLSFDLYPFTDNAFRQIEGTSPHYGITMFTGIAASGFLGTEMQLTDPGNTSTGTPGLIQFTSYYPSTYSGLSYNFQVGNTTSAASLFPVLQIDNKGHTLVGGITPPSPTDRLTVDGSIYLSTDAGTDIARNIYAKSSLSVFNITSGTFTDGSDGACQTMIALNNNTVSVPPWGTGTYEPGAFIVKSSDPPTCHNSCLAYAFQNYTPGSPGTVHNNFLINNIGQGIFGHDVDLTNITGPDVFTVKQQLGFWSPLDVDPRDINGNTNTGYLSLSSRRGSNDGSNITLFGAANTTGAGMGQIRFTSNGTTSYSMMFQNFDGTAYHKNVCIANDGRTSVGHDLDVMGLATTDVLTVLDAMGFYDANPNYWRTIHGNTNAGVLSLNSNTAFTNGSTIEMYSPSTPLYSGDDRSGRIRYISYSSTSPVGHDFCTIDGSAHFNSRMRIYSTGEVVIGDPLAITSYPNGPSSSTHQYSLYVQYGILTEQVRVAINGSVEWADYVFNKNYGLMPLSKVADYVKENNHLPGIPSSEEVKKEGIDLGSMDSKLLQKIEELTLYAIDQQKRIDAMQKKLDELTNK